MSINKYKIAVFTGTRAEYGLMKYLIKKIKFDNRYKLQLIVSGSHLSKKYGNTISEITEDQIDIEEIIPLSLDKKPTPNMTILTSEVMYGMSIALQKLHPNLLFLLGDRYETFGAAAAAHLHSIPIAHLHGGETTLGAVDDKLRHAISQLSTWHFTAANEYRDRVINMGHCSENVFMFGPMAIDGLVEIPELSKFDFEKATGFVFASCNILVTYHPETLLSDNGVKGFEELLTALGNVKCNILFTHPNADEGSEVILKKMFDFVNLNPDNCFAIPSLGQKLYLYALSVFQVMVGNSSSGIIEAPLMGIPILNIGNRQKDRIRYGEVLDVNAKAKDIKNGLDKLLNSTEAKDVPRQYKYEDSTPSEKILGWLNCQKQN
ncbi:UDP-N-acetylglucosamine 2-epimerase [Prochlorococcus sp. MIT 1011]|uniref:UDP-N-acetylglucosamine 2-epimerase n=1 Tax=Prochlorococcus sp. MIT 1011 TaxID=3082520 RepID=UPI0039B5E26E